MKFYSTRNKDITITAGQAMIRGLAEDGGLFVPENLDVKIPQPDYANISYQDLAFAVMRPFLDDFTDAELRTCISLAYDDKYDTAEIAPLRQLSDSWLLELWHGPTAAFKDLALTIMPHMLTAAYAKEGRDDTVAILTATSGDTGKAALAGFADVPNTAITVFFPEDGVSPVQKRQMQTSRGDNVSVIAVRGNFDDCQRMVKECTTDPEVRAAGKHVTISSANSINIGRLLPQMVYYYAAYAALVKSGAITAGEEVSFSVPTGNFGDILAGYMARQSGLPVRHLICASNENNVLTDFLHTGTYDARRPFHMTMSPSMDILISSNLERLLFFASNGDDAMVRACMQALKKTGAYTIPAELLAKLQEIFIGFYAPEEACRKEIAGLYQNEQVLIDPHTAVAMHAMHEYKKKNPDIPCVVLSTASPFKFSRSVLACLDQPLPEDEFAAMRNLAALSGLKIPQGLAELETLPVRFREVIDRAEGKAMIMKRMEELSHD